MIDLHVHSTASDGTMTPEELVDYAIEKGLTAMALTDHDTVSGLDRIIKYADSLRDQGKKDVPKIIPGIEFSTDVDGNDVHIVGLYINYESKEFTEYLDNFIASRELRNEKICNLLKEDGYDFSYEELKSKFNGSTITRAHFARLFYEKGYVKSYQEAFDRFIGDRCKYYIPREKVDPEMAIDLILKADGIPILAHPILYHLSDKRLDALVSRLKKSGLIGIEAIYSTYAPSEERQIRRLAEKYHLLLSGGSDFHGANKKNIDLGTGMGKLYVPDDILDKLEQVRKNIFFSDIDGTLLNDQSEITEEMKASIKRITDLGHLFVLTSGRPLPSILEQKVKFGLNNKNMWAISNNGGLIYDCEHDKYIKEVKLSQELLAKSINIVKKYGVHVHSYSQTEIIGYEDDEEMKYYRARIHMPLILTDDIASYLKDGAYKVQIISLTDKPLLENIKSELIKELGDFVDVVFTNNYYLEILPKGINKGDAILFLTEYLSFPHSHTYAGGDADNDIQMLKAASHGVAMANALDHVKEAANIVTKMDNNHNGLIEIFDMYFN